MGDLNDFQRGQMFGVRLAGASMIRTVALRGVSRAAVSEVMSIYTNHGKTASAERNSGRKWTLIERDWQSYSERDCFDKSILQN
jgi:hypothetical protein